MAGAEATDPIPPGRSPALGMDPDSPANVDDEGDGLLPKVVEVHPTGDGFPPSRERRRWGIWVDASAFKRRRVCGIIGPTGGDSKVTTVRRRPPAPKLAETKVSQASGHHGRSSADVDLPTRGMDLQGGTVLHHRKRRHRASVLDLFGAPRGGHRAVRGARAAAGRQPDPADVGPSRGRHDDDEAPGQGDIRLQAQAGQPATRGDRHRRGPVHQLPSRLPPQGQRGAPLLRAAGRQLRGRVHVPGRAGAAGGRASGHHHLRPHGQPADRGCTTPAGPARPDA